MYGLWFSYNGGVWDGGPVGGVFLSIPTLSGVVSSPFPDMDCGTASMELPDPSKGTWVDSNLPDPDFGSVSGI